MRVLLKRIVGYCGDNIDEQIPVRINPKYVSVVSPSGRDGQWSIVKVGTVDYTVNHTMEELEELFGQ